MTGNISQETIAPAKLRSVQANSVYRTIWRWHFYAGLFCIPFIITLAISGSIYLFKPQIDALVEKPYRNLSPVGTRASPQQHIDSALTAVPGSIFVSYRLPEHKNDAVLISVKDKGKRILVYVHPYTREVLKQIPYNSQFIRQVRSFHGELMLGNGGSILVELAGCWAIVMIVTGLYLWWPRSASGLAGVLYPRLRSRKRQLLRDLHAVSGFWVAGFTLFLLVSGLPWALVWGSAFKEIRALSEKAVEQSWVVKSTSEHEEHTQHSAPTPNKVYPLSDSLLAKAVALNFASPVELGPNRKNANEWQLSSQHQNRTLRTNAWFDAQSGAFLRVETFSGKSTIDKVVGIGISAHEGHLFGWVNQLLGLLTSSALLLVSVTGFILWRKRKPDGVLGAPPSLPNSGVGIAVCTITLGLALFLPLLALSLIALFILEYGVFRHIPFLAAWLGLKVPSGGETN